MADIDPFEGAPSLPKIVAVSLQQTGHLYNFLAGDRQLRRGERVLVESEAGARVGTVEIEPHEPAQTIDLSAVASDHPHCERQRLLPRAGKSLARGERAPPVRRAHPRAPNPDEAGQRRLHLRRAQGNFLFRRRGPRRFSRPGPRSRQHSARARRDETDWRARRDQSHRRPRSVRTRAMLLELAARLRGGDRQDGA